MDFGLVSHYTALCTGILQNKAVQGRAIKENLSEIYSTLFFARLSGSLCFFIQPHFLIKDPLKYMYLRNDCCPIFNFLLQNDGRVAYCSKRWWIPCETQHQSYKKRLIRKVAIHGKWPYTANGHPPGQLQARNSWFGSDSYSTLSFGLVSLLLRHF